MPSAQTLAMLTTTGVRLATEYRSHLEPCLDRRLGRSQKVQAVYCCHQKNLREHLMAATFV
ncbi:MAG: hypothetical protein ACK55Z_34575, partial [bacterium]